MIKKIIPLISIICITVQFLQAENYSVQSPDGQTVINLSCTESELSYTLLSQSVSLLGPSVISLIEDSSYTVIGAETVKIDQTWKPVWGQLSEVRDNCCQLTIKLKLSEVRVNLIARVYNDGIGLRLAVPAQRGRLKQKIKFHFEYRAYTDYKAYYPAGEREPAGPIPLSSLAASDTKLNGLPLVLDTGRNKWLALLESDLYSAKLFSSARFSILPGTQIIRNKVELKATDEGFVTPWKVIIHGASPGDLLTNTVSLNLAAPCKIKDQSWVKPGKGLWDWRIHGYNNGEFTYGIDTQSYFRLIDFASAQGIEYLTIDDHWFTVTKSGVIEPVPEVNMNKVMQHAKSKGVKVILYYDRNKGKVSDQALFKRYRQLGVAGIKYGFMGNKAGFTRQAIEDAADEQLLIFFHDGPVPMTGVERTLPNLISREYCHAQQDSRRAFSPTSFLKMAMINALTGPLDQANGNFGIKSINSGERLKGPRKKNSYVSTVVSEVARCLVIFSGLITLPDAPEEYLKKADLFEFLKQMPASWDETRILNSKMGEYITTARRSGKTWFVGSVNNEIPRKLEIALDFLTPSITYEATIFQDTKESNGLSNPEVYEIFKNTVQAGDTITAAMAVGGGHAMILRPVQKCIID